MKQLAVFVFFVVSVFSSSVFSDVSIGKLAPEFTLENSLGEGVSLKTLRGKKVILEWTNHECPFVKKHYESNNMQSLQKKYTDKGVVWLSIISSAKGKQGQVSAEQANILTKERSASPSFVLFDIDGKVGKLYGAKTTPHMYIIDEQGVLRYNGAIDSIPSTKSSDIVKAENYVDSAMLALDKGEVLKDSLTRPYGCSVKY